MDGPEVSSRCFKTALLIAICCLSAVAAQNDSISSTTTVTSSTVTSTTLPTTTETILASTSTHEPSSSPTSTSSATTPTTMTSTTETVKKVNTSCSSTSECVNGAECIDAICTCSREFYVTTDGQCKSKLTLGATCEEDTQCTDNAECQNATCVCTRDYYPVNDRCLRQVGLGENCTSPAECIDANTKCVTNICSCVNGYFNYNVSCLKVDKLKPENFHAADIGSKRITVTWDQPFECRSNCRYSITWTSTDTKDSAIINSPPHELMGLSAGVSYNISVQTLYNDSFGDISESDKKMITTKTIESQAENLTVSNVTSSSAVVSFYEPKEENRTVFRLEIWNIKKDTFYCIALYRNSTSDNVCGDQMNTTDNKRKKAKITVGLNAK